EVSHTIDAPEVNAAPMQRLRELKAKMRHELGEVWLREAHDVGRYLLAAQAKQANAADAQKLGEGLDAARIDAWIMALKSDKLPLDGPLALWRALIAAKPDAWPATWKHEAERYAKEERERTAFNQGFTSFGDFRSGDLAGWQIGGQGLRQGPTRSGDF